MESVSVSSFYPTNSSNVNSTGDYCLYYTSTYMPKPNNIINVRLELINYSTSKKVHVIINKQTCLGLCNHTNLQIK